MIDLENEKVRTPIHAIWDECTSESTLFVLTAGLVIDEAWWHLIKNVSFVCAPVLTVVNWCYQQELFSKQKGFLEEELDYRKQALDQSQLVGLLRLCSSVNGYFWILAYNQFVYVNTFTNVFARFCSQECVSKRNVVGLPQEMLNIKR